MAGQGLSPDSEQSPRVGRLWDAAGSLWDAAGSL